MVNALLRFSGSNGLALRWTMVVALSALAALPLRAQTPADTTRLGDEVEATLDALDVGDDADPRLVERLTDLAINPLNLNTAGVDDLLQLPFITAQVARSIVTGRQQVRAFDTWEDVLKIEGVAASTLALLQPYARVAPPNEQQRGWSAQALRNNVQGQFIQRVSRRLDLGRGYETDSTRTTYRGSPERIYTRLTLTANDRLGLNLTLDKDPGEAFAWDPGAASYGFDHVAGHVALHKLGPVERLILGDFTASYGQGVTLWQGFSFGKSRRPVRGLVRRGDGLDGFGSTEENRFFRGAAATVRLHPALRLSGFVSRRRLDARLRSVPMNAGDGAQRVVSFAESGLHRTKTELQQKDAALAETLGGNLSITTDALSLGAVSYWTRYSPARVRSERPSDRFDVAGGSWHALGLYGSALWADVQLFGEATRTASGAIGGIGGIQIDAAPWAEALLLGRHYPASFASPYGRAFGERNGATQNESGWYAGLVVRPHSEITVSAYVDQYRFPWLRFGVDRPTAGYEGRLIVEHTPHRWLTHYVQLQSETKEQAATVRSAPGPLVEGVRPETRQSLRWHGQFTFSDRLHLRTRVEGVRHRAGPQTEHGVMLYQGARWTPTKRLQLDGRIALFDTEGFDARIYAYEHDVLYAFSIPVFSGRGGRSYLKIRYVPIRRLTLEAKYAVSRYRGVDTIGSGLEATDGNLRRDVRVQLRWAW